MGRPRAEDLDRWAGHKERAREMFELGHTGLEVSIELGVSANTIAAWKREMGLVNQPRQPRPQKPQKDLTPPPYRRGWSWTAGK